jgi:hypothetical protein
MAEKVVEILNGLGLGRTISLNPKLSAKDQASHANQEFRLYY